MNIRFLGVAAAALVLALGLAGCGSSGSSTGGSSATKTSKSPSDPLQPKASKHACKLLSTTEAGTVMGDSYPAANETPNGGSCNYVSKDGNKNFAIFVDHTASTLQWNQTLAIVKADGGAEPTPVSGVGDQAAAAGREFAFQTHGWTINIDGADFGGTYGQYPLSTKLAQAMIPNLG